MGERGLSATLVGEGLAWCYRNDDPALVRLQADAVAARRGVHGLLDGPAARGPWLLTRRSFHHPDCGLVRRRAARMAWAAGAAEALAAGRAPCRRCLSWPPAAGARPVRAGGW